MEVLTRSVGGHLMAATIQKLTFEVLSADGIDSLHGYRCNSQWSPCCLPIAP